MSKTDTLPPEAFVTIGNVRTVSEKGRNTAVIRLHNGCGFTVSGAALRLSGKGINGKKIYLPLQEFAGLSVGPGEDVSLPPVPIPSKWNGLEAEVAFVRAGDSVCRLSEDGTIERTYGKLPPVGHAVVHGKRQMRDRVAFCRKTAIWAAVISAVVILGLGVLSLFLADLESRQPVGPTDPAEPTVSAEMTEIHPLGEMERI